MVRSGGHTGIFIWLPPRIDDPRWSEVSFLKAIPPSYLEGFAEGDAGCRMPLVHTRQRSHRDDNSRTVTTGAHSFAHHPADVIPAGQRHPFDDPSTT
ncbi:hypothetical protein C0Q70_08156 [Pomacea canaliculata]|uniref:Uncharacterized protein n=1 Tax=Pomacea canaliculata TaxID=400727 RepID=A0A2T7PH16_POMCA|nr:hypothetical protein C0Q70_08156 [Pomacea canaliculata]